MPTPPDQIPVPEIRRNRRRSGLRSAMAVLLATALCVLVNILTDQFEYNLPFSRHLDGNLSEPTADLLRQTDGDIEIIAYFDSASPLALPVDAVLKQFTRATRELDNIRLTTKVIESDRRTDEAAEFTRRHNAPPNSIVVRSPTDAKVITSEELIAQDLDRGDNGGTIDFIGELRIASAIWDLTRASNPVIYFLQGSGEYDPDDYDPQNGYSTAAQTLRNDLYTVRKLDLSETPAIPLDCAVLVVAGPRAHLPVRTIELLANHLASGGRLLALLNDPTDQGLAGLLRRWGVTLNPPAHPGAKTDYRIVSKLSPITRALTGVVPVFGTGCRLSPDPAAIAPDTADKPLVDVLLAPRRTRTPFGPAASAAPATAPTPTTRTPVADATDASGNAADAASPPPAPDGSEDSIAVAIQRGRNADMTDHALRVRAVVVGDSEFASNAMAGYGGNIPFFLASIRWLSERSTRMRNPPVVFRILDSGLTRERWPIAVLAVIGAWPFAILLVGYFIFRRR